MSQYAIRATGLGKRYKMGPHLRYRTLRDTITDAFRVPFRGRGDARPGGPDYFWALKDIGFDVKHGEVVGIIGRNGAGKSTLLKLLARVTEPSEGRATIHGRIASLLEVGTGFHPELSGRENVYLNGVILGMRKAEVRRKFDEIVAFAEMEQFIDMPVKHYSSGMAVRLAFAVAAHLEPEVLFVDEVLAVGDAGFQKKCLGKMDSVAREGRTILFVSHNMGAITRLCQRGIVLEHGRVVLDAPVYEASARYMHSELGTSAHRSWNDMRHAPGDDTAKLKSVRVLCGGETAETVDIRVPVTLEMEYWNRKPGSRLITAFSFFNDQGTLLFVSANFQEELGPQPEGLYRARCTVPGNLFSEGEVRVAAEVSTRQPVYLIHLLEHDAVSFQVVETGEPGSVRGSWTQHIPGAVRPMLPWKTEVIAMGACAL